MTYRTHMGGDLRAADEGQRVTVAGVTPRLFANREIAPATAVVTVTDDGGRAGDGGADHSRPP